MAGQLLLGADTPTSSMGLGREHGAQPEDSQGYPSGGPGMQAVGGCDPPCSLFSLSASRIVEEAVEIAVPDAQAAISVYAWGLGAVLALQPPADGRSAMRG